MKCIVTQVSEGRVRLEEFDTDGKCQASTVYASNLEGDALLEWAKSKAPRAASVEFATPAPAGKKSKTK